MTTPQIIYSLCALTSFACAALLFRGWLRSRARLLFWSALCFAGLTLNNVLLVIDRIVLGPEVSLAPYRLVTALTATLLLVYGLIQSDR